MNPYIDVLDRSKGALSGRAIPAGAEVTIHLAEAVFKDASRSLRKEDLAQVEECFKTFYTANTLTRTGIFKKIPPLVRRMRHSLPVKGVQEKHGFRDDAEIDPQRKSSFWRKFDGHPTGRKGTKLCVPSCSAGIFRHNHLAELLDTPWDQIVYAAIYAGRVQDKKRKRAIEFKPRIAPVLQNIVFPDGEVSYEIFGLMLVSGSSTVMHDLRLSHVAVFDAGASNVALQNDTAYASSLR